RQSHRGWWDPIRITYVVLRAVLVIGLGMIAGEVRANEFWQFVTRVWRSSASGKTAILVVIFVLVSALAYGTYYVFFWG
ncbi:MAG: hypothetical protein WA982_00225, partial [Rubrobacteraceae bacterium]